MSNPIRRTAAVALILTLLATPAAFSPAPAEAAVPKLDTIRVGLILEANKLKSTVSAVTVSSPKGLSLTLKTAAASLPIPGELAPSGKLRAAGDGYQVRLLETGEYAKAKTLADQLKTASAAITVTASQRSGKTLYTVSAAGYPTKDAAAQALVGFSQLPAVAALAEKPVLGGPFRLQAGAYAALAEAEKQRTALAQAGLDSSLALIDGGGVLQYAVWTGAEADAESLAAYKLKALKLMPALSPAAADTSNYANVLSDVTGTADGSSSVPLLLVPVQGAKLWIAPKEGELTVAEKLNRTYRGAMEVSVHNGKLAVINELPFEQYLYSVVSGEMGKGWPAEALKAQAVAARTYALKSGTKYQIAHVSDSTLDQVYDGNEDADSIQAVDATAGEVLVDKDGLITAFFSANSGGMSSSGADVWGTALPYLKTVPSPDEGAAKNKAIWKRGVLPDGQVAYVHSSYLKDSGRKTALGLAIYQVTEAGVNARSAPYVDNTGNPPVAKLNAGDSVIVFGEAQESNSYSWTRGPYTPDELLRLMNDKLPGLGLAPVQGPLSSLEVKTRGDSGRVTELNANGKSLKLSAPDNFRTLLGGLPSTRFEIDRSGGYTILGANGRTSVASGGTLYAVSAGGQTAALPDSGYFVLNGSGQMEYGTASPEYTITGTGNGHGAGLSQWGARGFAELGYDYKKILSTYYQGVTLTKD
ncbi:SpoIID/LytB domain-containing protein [Gorillibacterium sp. sgz5001074]|uniref:SpoIID/LytB domain-containing protein n=1 Tax=Gorillibacterium sp. sgz5001074 TaxID=3446695 RepID=UPI003F6739AC